MADTKISALTALTGANSDPLDLIPIVDTSATTTKSITRQEFQTYNAGTLTTDVKVLDLSVTWNAAGVTFTGLKFNVATDTASNAASLLMDLQVGGASKFKVAKTGTVTAVSYAGSGASSPIAFSGNDLTIGTDRAILSLGATLSGWGAYVVAANGAFGFASSTNSATSGSADTAVYRISAGVIGAGTGISTPFAGRTKSTSKIVAGVAVGSLNAAPTTGEIQSVTDATAPAVGVAVAAGGAAKALVWWNGAQWTVIGI